MGGGEGVLSASGPIPKAGEGGCRFLQKAGGGGVDRVSGSPGYIK